MQTLADRFTALTEWLAALPDWQAFLVVVGTSLCAAALIQVGGDALITRLTARIPGEVDDVILGYAHVAVWTSVGLVGIYLGIGQLDVPAALLGVFHAATLTVVTLIWAYTLVRSSPVVLEAITARSYVDRQVVPIFGNVWTAIVGGVSLFLVLSYWGINITPLLASAGVLGIVVGLAARDAIANLFGSLALYADGTYTVGDYVVLESGERGRVEDISIRSTVVRTRDDILVTIPNARLNSGAIVNESAPERHRRIAVSVGVAYGTDVERVETLLLSIAEENDAVRERPKPRVFMQGFGDSALELDLLCWIEDPRLRERVQDELLRGIYARFQAEDIEIPYPQRDVNVAGVPEEDVPVPVDPTEESVSATEGSDHGDGTRE